MFNVRDNKWEPGFRVGLPEQPSGRQIASNAVIRNPYFPSLAGISEMLAFRIPSLPSSDPPIFPPWPNDNADGSIQPVKKPIKCSGPRSTCGLPYRIRANGVFLDPENPPFRLCRPCFIRAYGRTPTGEDT
jgi:hypothetical protein